MRLFHVSNILDACQGDRFDMHGSPGTSKQLIKKEVIFMQPGGHILQELVRDVCKNDIHGVKKILQAYPPLVQEVINHEYPTCLRGDSRNMRVRKTTKETSKATLLAVAVRMGHKEMVKELLTYSGHDFKQVCDKLGNGLLATAIINNLNSYSYREIIEMLLEKTKSGLDVNQANQADQTPLCAAVWENQFEIVKLLLAHKAIVNIEDLFMAVQNNNIEIFSLLLDHVENKDELMNWQCKGTSLLSYSVAQGNIEFVKLCMKHRTAGSPLPNDTDFRRAFCQATGAGYYDIVELMLQEGVDINFTIEDDGGATKSPLVVAATKDDEKMLNMLIKNKETDAAFFNIHGYYALYYAIKYWKPDMINILLDVVDYDSSTKNNKRHYDALLIDLFQQYYDHKTSKDDRQLIEKICQKYTRSKLAVDDLIPELMKDHARFIELFENYINLQNTLANTVELDIINPRGKPLLSYAVEFGSMKIFTMLCQFAYNINQKDPSGRTPLAYAAQRGDFQKFDQLLKKKADCTAKDFSGRSILSYALECLHNEPHSISSQCIVQKLLNHDGHDVSEAQLTDREYVQLLDFALQRKKMQWISKLHIFDRCISSMKNYRHILTILDMLRQEDYKTHLEQEDRAGRTLLSHFAKAGSVELVQSLMGQSSAIHINQVDDMGRTPLFYALQAGHMAIVDILLQNGADVNHVDRQESTPLLYAIQSKCRKDAIEMLLAHKADLSYCDRGNQGALSYAISTDHLSVVDLLLPKMIEDPNCHAELCVALLLAKNKNDKELDNKLVSAIAPLFEQDDCQGWVDQQRPKKWKATTVIFSMHAEQRAEERDIKLDTIKEVIENPYTIQHCKRSDHILKLIKHNICVVIAKEQAKITVITAYDL